MKIAKVALAVLCSGVASLASAQTYGFDCISTGSGTSVNCPVGESQLRMNVGSNPSGSVLFTFTNTGTQNSSITGVFFDNGPLGSIAGIIEGPGVNYSVDRRPANFPGGGSLTPRFDTSFSADADAPPPFNGVNPGETLGILFNLQAGRSFADVTNQLASGALRVGLRVQAFSNGGSASFVNLTAPVPEASTLLYAISGLGVLAFWRRRRQQG